MGGNFTRLLSGNRTDLESLKETIKPALTVKRMKKDLTENFKKG
jgi:hypothetical protein